MTKGVVAAVVGAVLLAGCGSSHNHAAPPPVAATTVSTVAASTTTAATTTTTVPSTYVVQQGDTLTSIAQHFNITVAALMKANNITNADKVEAGQTLKIPASHPATLTIAPATGPRGQEFQLKLSGAQSGEKVTFTVKSPKGSFTGPAHAVPDDGNVATTYKTALADPTGTYTVTASGNQGTSARATFVVTASTTTTS